jgi:hypothetical protein
MNVERRGFKTDSDEETIKHLSKDLSAPIRVHRRPLGKVLPDIESDGERESPKGQG